LLAELTGVMSDGSLLAELTGVMSDGSLLAELTGVMSDGSLLAELTGVMSDGSLLAELTGVMSDSVAQDLWILSVGVDNSPWGQYQALILMINDKAQFKNAVCTPYVFLVQNFKC
jgi:hypothetical protein